MASQDESTDTGNGESEESMTPDVLVNKWKQAEETIARMKGEWGSQKDEITRENQTLKQQLAMLAGRVDEQRSMFDTKNQASVADPFELDEETADSFRNDPTNIVSFFKKRLEEQQDAYVSAVVGMMKERDEQVYSKFQEIDGTLGTVKRVVDPEIAPWKENIDGLREKGGVFAKLDDQSLIEIAKQIGMKPMEYRGTAGSGRHSSGDSGKIAEFDPNSVQGRLMLKFADGDLARAKNMWKRQASK